MPVSILVVDDDAAFREAICRALRRAGYEIEEAADGAQALRILNEKPAQILMTDVIMPDNDGIQLIHAVRRACPTVRILAVSGHRKIGGLDLLNLAAMIGADATLTKPFSTEELLEKVAALTGPKI